MSANAVVAISRFIVLDETHLDLRIQSSLLFIQLVVVVRVHLEIVEFKLLPDLRLMSATSGDFGCVREKARTHPLLESLAFLQRQRVRLGNDGHDIDHVRKLLEHDNVDGFQTAVNNIQSIKRRSMISRDQGQDPRMTRWLDEEETAVDASILHVAFSVRREFFAQIGRVLILDVLDNGIPTVAVSQPFPPAAGARPCGTYHRSLLTRSPYPGVSTMLRRRRTPFSSMTGLTSTSSPRRKRKHTTYRERRPGSRSWTGRARRV